METPSSMRRVTRSQQASLVSEKKMQEGAEKTLPSLSRNRGEKQDRPVLHDITNDSPIVGLAVGSLKTPSSSTSKCSAWSRRWTPGSGEALLRGQVKILLQKVDEEAEVVKHSAEQQPAPFKTLLGHLRSPGGLLAPTPANTPEITGLSSNKEGFTPQISSAKEDVNSELQLGAEIPKYEQEEDLGECLLNRALFDSPEKSEISDSSSVTYQGSDISGGPERSTEDDCSSAWSMRVHTGSQKEDEEDEGVDEDFRDDDGDGYYEGEEEEETESLDALCEGLRMMSVREGRGLPEFVGKHTRFVYDSDGAIEGKEEVKTGMVSPSVLRLRGLPVPEGKHLRFQEEEDD